MSGGLTVAFRTAALAVALILAAGMFGAPALLAQEGTPPMRAADAWIMRAPPVMKMQAGYLTLHNEGTAARALVVVTSPSYGHIEMHLSREIDGVATMQHVSQVEVPAGGTVAFRPGGLHLMLKAPTASVASAERVLLQLVFDDGSILETWAVLRSTAPRGLEGGPGHDGMHAES